MPEDRSTKPWPSCRCSRPSEVCIWRSNVRNLWQVLSELKRGPPSALRMARPYLKNEKINSLRLYLCGGILVSSLVIIGGMCVRDTGSCFYYTN